MLTHDISNPTHLTRSPSHTGKINSVTYNHNSRVLASSGDDGNIVLSHTETAERLAVLEPLSFPASPINSISFTSKSDMIGCGSLDGIVRVWDLRKKEVTASFNYHTDSVSCVTWNYTDQQIVSSSMSGEIMVHSLLTKVSVGNLKQRGSAGIKVIQFSPFKKNMLGAGSENGSVYIWDINTRFVACAFPSFHNSPVTGLSFSAINHMLMCTSGLDQRINFYDTQEKKIVKTIEADAPLTCIAFNTDGHTLAGGTLYGTILIYDLRMPGIPKATLKGHEGNAVNWLEFAKSRDIKARQQRETSRENREIKENSTKIEENNTTVSRFRTIEEIRLEAKLRVEKNRRDKNKDEPKAELKPEPITTSKTLLVNPQEKSPLLNKEIIKPLRSNQELQIENGFNGSKQLGKESFIEEESKEIEKIEEKKFEKKVEESNWTTDADKGEIGKRTGLVELIENRLNLQDEAIFELKEDVQNLHVELIRQFMIQIVSYI